ncbi:DUF3549 family protein [Glaciecola petra]|uniref:DUF3549 family protein n=1 Tax=Glaciecola petra TaxID=3075602 RepID=A0ABU2ZPZ9_9ALTE|nr:DUF3549 family protein [Aestuariibacter sp. P117]MDT0593689.1 DUF3549 family protein [Aestuariibacter sp. P117]
MSDNAISTLSEFLLQAQTQYLVFDLGRGIRKIDNQVFFEWENQQEACAFPRQNHVWLCIVFWNEKLSHERYIWFVKLPLDEQGLIIPASRDQFLEIIVQALGKELEHNEDKQAKLPENPFVFTPSQQQLADCNALIRASIGIIATPSEKALQYIKAPKIQDWSVLSVQEIADLICFADKNTQASIAQQLPHFAPPVLSCLFASLENNIVEDCLLNALIAYHENSNDVTLSTLCLRAMSFQPNDRCIKYVKNIVLNNNDISLDTCVVIVGRFWQLCEDDNFLVALMHKIATIDESAELFKSLYADLVKIPSIRTAMLGFIRNEKRSDAVANAIGHLFNTQLKA